jgi:hypothetical protein
VNIKRIRRTAGEPQDRTPTEAAIAFARADLASFATLMHRRFELTRHHRLIIEQLERVERGEIDRLMLAMPPRHGKSLISSEIFPAWYLGRHSIIAASYGQELASDFGRKVRNRMADDLYRAVFPQAPISPDTYMGFAGRGAFTGLQMMRDSEHWTDDEIVVEGRMIGNTPASSRASRPPAVRWNCRSSRSIASTRLESWCRSAS